MKDNRSINFQAKFFVNKVGKGHPRRGAWTVCVNFNEGPLSVPVPIELTLDEGRASSLVEVLNRAYDSWKMRKAA